MDHNENHMNSHAMNTTKCNTKRCATDIFDKPFIVGPALVLVAAGAFGAIATGFYVAYRIVVFLGT